jgi:hypothetical protein
MQRMRFRLHYIKIFVAHSGTERTNDHVRNVVRNASNGWNFISDVLHWFYRIRELTRHVDSVLTLALLFLFSVPISVAYALLLHFVQL